jgi:hypothetical protein
MDKHVLLDILEAYHLAHVVKFLHRNGILCELSDPRHPRDIASLREGLASKRHLLRLCGD